MNHLYKIAIDIATFNGKTLWVFDRSSALKCEEKERIEHALADCWEAGKPWIELLALLDSMRFEPTTTLETGETFYHIDGINDQSELTVI